MEIQRKNQIQVPSEVFLPDRTDQLVTLFHREHSADTARLRRMNGYWQIPKLGKTPTRDRYYRIMQM